MEENSEQLLLARWRDTSSRHQTTHFESVDRLARFGSWLGVTVIVLSAIVGTSIFATLQEDKNMTMQIVTGLISFAAAELASLQTFLRFAERSESHRVAAANYGALRRLIEEEQTQFPETDEGKKELLRNIRSQLDQLAKESPKPVFVRRRVSKDQLLLEDKKDGSH